MSTSPRMCHLCKGAGGHTSNTKECAHRHVDHSSPLLDPAQQIHATLVRRKDTKEESKEQQPRTCTHSHTSTYTCCTS